jgi:hypothetical protein
VAVGARKAAAGGAKRNGEGGRGVVGERLPVADGDRRGGDSSKRAARREGPDERVHADRLDVVGEEVADRAEDIRRDEDVAVGDPESSLVPAGEANDAACLEAGGERASHRNAVARRNRVGVAAVAGHEERDSDHARVGEGRVELGRVDGVDEQPALVEANGCRRSPQELVRVGEPGEAPVLVEWVRLQGAGW